jgi:hypothetical protein
MTASLYFGLRAGIRRLASSAGGLRFDRDAEPHGPFPYAFRRSIHRLCYLLTRLFGFGQFQQAAIVLKGPGFPNHRQKASSADKLQPANKLQDEHPSSQ